jgi:hypothetical protein
MEGGKPVALAPARVMQGVQIPGAQERRPAPALQALFPVYYDSENDQRTQMAGAR